MRPNPTTNLEVFVTVEFTKRGLSSMVLSPLSACVDGGSLFEVQSIQFKAKNKSKNKEDNKKEGNNEIENKGRYQRNTLLKSEAEILEMAGKGPPFAFVSPLFSCFACVERMLKLFPKLMEIFLFEKPTLLIHTDLHIFYCYELHSCRLLPYSLLLASSIYVAAITSTKLHIYCLDRRIVLTSYVLFAQSTA
jgi:hypothetical protein